MSTEKEEAKKGNCLNVKEEKDERKWVGKTWYVGSCLFTPFSLNPLVSQSPFLASVFAISVNDIISLE